VTRQDRNNEQDVVKKYVAGKRRKGTLTTKRRPGGGGKVTHRRRKGIHSLGAAKYDERTAAPEKGPGKEKNRVVNANRKKKRTFDSSLVERFARSPRAKRYSMVTSRQNLYYGKREVGKRGQKKEK